MWKSASLKRLLYCHLWICTSNLCFSMCGPTSGFSSRSYYIELSKLVRQYQICSYIIWWKPSLTARFRCPIPRQLADALKNLNFVLLFTPLIQVYPPTQSGRALCLGHKRADRAQDVKPYVNLKQNLLVHSIKGPEIPSFPKQTSSDGSIAKSSRLSRQKSGGPCKEWLSRCTAGTPTRPFCCPGAAPSPSPASSTPSVAAPLLGAAVSQHLPADKQLGCSLPSLPPTTSHAGTAAP